MLAAWCEMRGDFRYFRTDRMDSARVLAERFPERGAVLRARWRTAMDAERWRYVRDWAAGHFLDVDFDGPEPPSEDA